MTQRDNETYDAFARALAKAATVPTHDMNADARLIEDLAVDSIGLAEIVVTLLLDYDMEWLADALGARDWSGITVGQLYDEYCSGRPASYHAVPIPGR